MKRHKALHALSHDHHLGLIVARRLIKTGEGKFPVMETRDGFLEFWKENLEPHFGTEETAFAPLLSISSLQGGDVLWNRVQAEHEALRMSVTLLTGRGEDRLRILLWEIGKALHDHIRFEEREFFPALEKELSEVELQVLGGRLLEARPQSCLPPEQLKLLREAMGII